VASNTGDNGSGPDSFSGGITVLAQASVEDPITHQMLRSGYRCKPIYNTLYIVCSKMMSSDARHDGQKTQVK
jgi:hypothetical protein